MSVFACTTLPPKAWPIAWWPRHTPRIGTRPAKRRITSSETPASFGVQGPGESTMRSGASASISSTDISSLRTTFTSCAQLAQVLHQVVGERVVVVDHQEHGSHPLERVGWDLPIRKGYAPMSNRPRNGPRSDETEGRRARDAASSPASSGDAAQSHREAA